MTLLPAASPAPASDPAARKRAGKGSRQASDQTSDKAAGFVPAAIPLLLPEAEILNPDAVTRAILDEIGRDGLTGKPARAVAVSHLAAA